MYMIVGFEVSPCSIRREAGKPIQHVVCEGEDTALPPPQEVKEGADIVYSYDVYWQKNYKIKWASRWDSYLRMPGGKVHWFSILNSLLIVLVMASLVAMILIRTIRRDLAKYEQLMVDSSADIKDEVGWKLLTGDVFRSPGRAKSLAVHVRACVRVCVCVVWGRGARGVGAARWVGWRAGWQVSMAACSLTTPLAWRARAAADAAATSPQPRPPHTRTRTQRNRLALGCRRSWSRSSRCCWPRWASCRPRRAARC
jgi:hypothetical protein